MPKCVQYACLASFARQETVELIKPLFSGNKYQTLQLNSHARLTAALLSGMVFI